MTPLEILARAEKRLAPMIARLGAGHPTVLSTFATFERMYERAVDELPAIDERVDILTLVRAVA
jgi:hypothetical protein